MTKANEQDNDELASAELFSRSLSERLSEVERENTALRSARDAMRSQRDAALWLLAQVSNERASKKDASSHK